jgi:inward rectifier potassium channel
MSPQTLYADILVVIESVTGLLLVAMATGLMFARFARPSARVMFSQVAVISPHNGMPTLMFRAANQRYNQILEAKLWVVMLRTEVTLEGETIRRFYDLPLIRRKPLCLH